MSTFSTNPAMSGHAASSRTIVGNCFARKPIRDPLHDIHRAGLRRPAVANIR
jgi:hypothetical protein